MTEVSNCDYQSSPVISDNIHVRILKMTGHFFSHIRNLSLFFPVRSQKTLVFFFYINSLMVSLAATTKVRVHSVYTQDFLLLLC